MASSVELCSFWLSSCVCLEQAMSEWFPCFSPVFLQVLLFPGCCFASLNTWDTLCGMLFTLSSMLLRSVRQAALLKSINCLKFLCEMLNKLFKRSKTFHMK
uniref:Secreted protein n=1 Tax=Anguilla anguilla TaxID=7936 RepID=A0A0E9VXJ9_ANGAN